MRKTLLATTALAFAGAMAAGSAAAADKMSAGVGGYMNQWVGMIGIEEGTYGSGDKARVRESFTDVVSDSEVIFSGKLEADNGLTFGVRVELEANNNSAGNGAKIDESYATVSGDFGTLRLGAEDSAQSLMHYSTGSAGMGLGALRKWLPENESYYTANWQADNKRIVYMTPRMSGVQFGVDYSPGANENSGDENDAELNNNDADSWSVALNAKQEFGGGNIELSVGHITKSGDDDLSDLNVGLRFSMDGITASIAHLAQDEDTDRDVTTAGLIYADGPMSVSLEYGMSDSGSGDASAVILSAGYSLAPGVSVNSSLFASESERTQATKSNGKVADSQDTGFVTGIKIGF